MWINIVLGAESLETRPITNAPGKFREYGQWLKRQDHDAAMDYWRKALAGMVQPTLVAAPPRGRAAFSPQGLPSVEEGLESELNESLRSLARSCGVSLAIVLQAGLARLLATRTGSKDALFGLTVSGRPSDLPAVETTMGSFINNVPVRVPVPAALSLPVWLREIQSAQAERNQYEHVSLAEVRRVSSLTPRMPSFDVLALLHSPAAELRRDRHFEIEQLPGPYDSAHTLTLSLAESMGTLLLTGVYEPQRMTSAAALSLSRDLREILTEFVTTPDALVGDLCQFDVGSNVQSNF